MITPSFIFWLKFVVPITSLVYIIFLIVSIIQDYYKERRAIHRRVREAAIEMEELAARNEEQRLKTLEKKKKNKLIAKKPLGITKKDYDALIKAGYKAWPLFIDNYKHDETLTLKNFIFLYISKLALNHKTIYKDGTTSCKANTYRSLGDILMVCSVLYPGITRLEIKQILVNDPNTVGHICPDIKRRIYCHKSVRSGWRLNHRKNLDEFNETLLDNIKTPPHFKKSIYENNTSST